MTDNKSMVMYSSYLEAAEELPSDEQCPLLKAILRYGFYDEEPTELSSYSRPIFTAIKPNIDKAKERYKKSVENGKKGGRPKRDNITRTPEEIIETINKAYK